MSAEWYYAANGQQSGPVDLNTLVGMLQAGSLSRADMVFGPNMTQWLAAGQVPALTGAGQGAASPYAASPLAYQGFDTATTGLSTTALEMLRQTKPWVRFMAIMTFIGAGFMVIAAVAMLALGTMTGGRGSGGVPPFLGLIYLVLAAIYIMPGVLLNRYASSIARLMQTQRMGDVEQALGAQKSFWKFVGIMMIVIMGIYLLIGVGAALVGIMR